jgi:hypothetical protein
MFRERPTRGLKINARIPIRIPVLGLLLTVGWFLKFVPTTISVIAPVLTLKDRRPRLTVKARKGSGWTSVRVQVYLAMVLHERDSWKFTT